MPPKRGIPALCVHRPSGNAYVKLGGRQIYLGRADAPDAKAKYDRTVAEWLTCGRSLPQVYGPTIAEVLAGYFDHVQRYYLKNGQPTKEVGCIRQAMKPVRTLYAATPAAVNHDAASPGSGANSLSADSALRQESAATP